MAGSLSAGVGEGHHRGHSRRSPESCDPIRTEHRHRIVQETIELWCTSPVFRAHVFFHEWLSWLLRDISVAAVYPYTEGPCRDRACAGRCKHQEIYRGACPHCAGHCAVCGRDQWALRDQLRSDNRRRGFLRRVHSPVSYTHLRAHETRHDLVCRLLLEKKKKKKK